MLALPWRTSVGRRREPGRGAKSIIWRLHKGTGAASAENKEKRSLNGSLGRHRDCATEAVKVDRNEEQI
jgi:hypothetical protein